MTCAHCGTSISDLARFCAICGSPVAGGGAHAVNRAQAGAEKLFRDFRSLKFSALFPVRDWLAERPWTLGSAQALAFLAFYPLLLSLIYDNLQLTDLTDQLKTSAWSLGLYFAVIWGVIIFRMIKPDRIEPQVLATTFLFTAVIGITITPMIKHLPIFSAFTAAKHSQDVGMRLLGYIFGVGFVEEAVKAAPLYFWFLIQKKPTTPREAAFAGVLSGLAFGVAEAVSYSIDYSNYQTQGKLTPGEFLIAQFLRIISLPLLHALWAGVVGYFIGLAASFPRKATPLVVVGLSAIAIIHGFYDTFSDGWFGLALCLLSLLLFIMYIRSAEKITEQLQTLPIPQAG